MGKSGESNEIILDEEQHAEKEVSGRKTQQQSSRQK